MTDQELWFEPISLLSRCSLSEGLLWVWADRVPVDSVHREKTFSRVWKTGNVNASRYLLPQQGFDMRPNIAQRSD
jgi:hypothetical protein